ncbi:hypothetical protein [Methylobacterium sp. A54F]
MKKIALLASTTLALSLVAGSAFAQSTSAPVLGVGTTANEAVVVQRGNGVGLFGYSFGNNATVDQSGTNNKAGRVNSYVDLSAGNLSTGASNATLDASYSVAQVGNYNNLSITQSGSNNSVVTTTGNWTRSSFGLDANGGSFQAGDKNKFTSTQAGTKGQVQFQQKGDRNVGTVSVENGAQNTYAGIFQDGYGNTGAINQYYSANNAYAAIVQRGNDNDATIKQSGVTNYAAVLQVGNSNDALITQSGAGVGAFGYQVGSYNNGTISQTGAGFANAVYAQSGTFNTVSIKQR